MIDVNPVVGYVVMEETSLPNKMKIEKVVNQDGMYFARFRTCLQSFDVFNRNKRNYSGAAMREALNAENVQELIKKGSWIGENGHPDSNDIKRIVTVDPCKASHRIVDFEIIGNLLYGTVESLNDDLYGKQLTKHIIQGVEPAFSLRALASIQNIAGKMYIKSKPYVVAYDRVIYPSHREAYRDESTPVKLVSESAQICTENTNIYTDVASKIMEKQLVDYILEESSQVKGIMDVFECSCDSVSFTKNKKGLIVKSGNQTYHIALEDYIAAETSYYLSKLI